MTDLPMPRLTGLGVAQRIHQIRPGTPIVLVTGLGVSMTGEMARQLGFKLLMAKPYEYTDLAETIARILSVSRGFTESAVRTFG